MEFENDVLHVKIKKWTKLTRHMAKEISEWITNESKEEDAPAKIIEEEKPADNIITIVEKKEEIKPEPKLITKPKYIRTRGKFTGLFSPDQILIKYNSIRLYKPVYEHIQKRVGDAFEYNNVKQAIEEYYRNVLRRNTRLDTIETYTSLYIKYHKTKKNDKPLSEKIYDMANKLRWTAVGREIEIATLGSNLPEYTTEEIYVAIAKLISERKVSQRPKNKVVFM
jgi:hypothetical protein